MREIMSQYYYVHEAYGKIFPKIEGNIDNIPRVREKVRDAPRG